MKSVKISLYDLIDGKCNYLYQVQKLQRCKHCYIMQIRPHVYSIYTLQEDGDFLPVNAQVDYDNNTIYYLPYQQRSRKAEPLHYFRLTDGYSQDIQTLANLVRCINEICRIYAGVAGCNVMLTRY